jgi:hypothetical protein
MYGQASLTRASAHGVALLLVIVALFAVTCGDDDSDVSVGDDVNNDGTGDTPAESTDGPDEATDEPLGGGPYPIADLTIAYQHPDEGIGITYTITCLGDTATVRGDPVELEDRAACLALADADVQRRLVDGPPVGVACTEQYGGPDAATITGTIDEQPVNTTLDRTNGCGISDWDDLLAAVLPSPIDVTS